MSYIIILARFIKQLFCFRPHFVCGELKPFMEMQLCFCLGKKYYDDVKLYECKYCGKRGIVGNIRSRLPSHYTEFDEIDKLCNDWVKYKVTLSNIIDYCKNKGWHYEL